MTENQNPLAPMPQDPGFKIQEFIPISHKDVHTFISELCSENLFLINLLNDLEVAQQERDEENKEEIRTLESQTTTNAELILLLKKKKVNLNSNTD